MSLMRMMTLQPIQFPALPCLGSNIRSPAKLGASCHGVLRPWIDYNGWPSCQGKHEEMSNHELRWSHSDQTN